MNVDAAYAQFGGRVALMYCLRELGGNAGIDVARFGGVDHETVGRLRAYAEEAWQQLGDARLFDDAFIEQTLAPFTEPFDNGIGLPVLKLSYLDNRNPDALSFAGVGATSIPRNQITSLSRCFCATIRGLGRPYARYYRKQHPEFESGATGLMIMEHLPTKDIWGTAWTHGSQLVLEVQSKLRGSYHARIASTDDARRIAGESRAAVRVDSAHPRACGGPSAFRHRILHRRAGADALAVASDSIVLAPSPGSAIRVRPG